MRTDARTDGHDEAHIQFSQICERACNGVGTAEFAVAGNVKMQPYETWRHVLAVSQVSEDSANFVFGVYEFRTLRYVGTTAKLQGGSTLHKVWVLVAGSKSANAWRVASAPGARVKN
jgi:hypothetical protein